MTVFELGAVGEFVGAILLFVSLIYVGVQVRQNTKTSRTESRRSSVDQRSIVIDIQRLADGSGLDSEICDRLSRLKSKPF